MEFIIIMTQDGAETGFQTDTFNPYPWILEKKSKTRDHHRACLAEKNPERSIELICICFCALDFFLENTLGHGLNGIYFF